MFQFNERQLSQKDAEEWALKSLDKQASSKTDDDSLDDPDAPLVPAAPRPPENASSAAASLLDKLAARRYRQGPTPRHRQRHHQGPPLQRHVPR